MKLLWKLCASPVRVILLGLLPPILLIRTSGGISRRRQSIPVRFRVLIRSVSRPSSPWNQARQNLFVNVRVKTLTSLPAAFA